MRPGQFKTVAALNFQRKQFAGRAKWSPYISVKYRSLAGIAVQCS